MKHIYDKDFKYTHSLKTDIRERFRLMELAKLDAAKELLNVQTREIVENIRQLPKRGQRG